MLHVLFKSLRLEKHLTQKALAELANIGERSIKHIESGDIKKPRQDTIKRLKRTPMYTDDPERFDAIIDESHFSTKIDSLSINEAGMKLFGFEEVQDFTNQNALNLCFARLTGYLRSTQHTDELMRNCSPTIYHQVKYLFPGLSTIVEGSKWLNIDNYPDEVIANTKDLISRVETLGLVYPDFVSDLERFNAQISSLNHTDIRRCSADLLIAIKGVYYSLAKNWDSIADGIQHADDLYRQGLSYKEFWKAPQYEALNVLSDISILLNGCDGSYACRARYVNSVIHFIHAVQSTTQNAMWFYKLPQD